jgi:hypothetical protein
MTDPQSDFKEIILKKIAFGISARIDAKCIKDFRPDILAEFLTDSLIVSIRCLIYGEELDSHKFYYPADWWQAFRVRWFPKWWLRRWPPKYREIDCHWKVLYPDFVPALPNEKQTFRFSQCQTDLAKIDVSVEGKL